MVSGRRRDFLYIALAVGAIFGALFLYTGVWPPVVVVESNSMMHVDAREYQDNAGTTFGEDVGFGRLGTVDPGDLVMIKDVDSFAEIETFAHGDQRNYGMRGDVIAFQATGGGGGLTVVHRAMTYVQVQGQGENLTYIVDWTNRWPEPETAECAREPAYVCKFGPRGVTIEPLDIVDKRFLGPGLITKGDNVATNPGADQARLAEGREGLNPQPVVMKQIKGTVHHELPGIGLLKLAFTGDTVLNSQAQDHPYFLRIGNMVAPVDLWLVLLGEIVALAAAPVVFAVGRGLWRARTMERSEELSVLQETRRNVVARGPDGPDEG